MRSRTVCETTSMKKRIKRITEIYCESLAGIGTVFGEFYIGDIKENTSAVSLESGKANHLEIGIYLGAVID